MGTSKINQSITILDSPHNSGPLGPPTLFLVVSPLGVLNFYICPNGHWREKGDTDKKHSDDRLVSEASKSVAFLYSSNPLLTSAVRGVRCSGDSHEFISSWIITCTGTTTRLEIRSSPVFFFLFPLPSIAGKIIDSLATPRVPTTPTSG